MRDLTIRLENRPGSLADIGEALGRAGINIAGGCGFMAGDKAIMHLLFDDSDTARRVLEDKGMEVIADNEVLAVKLNEDRPGQLGRITRTMANHNVNIEVIYLNRKDQLIMVVDDFAKGQTAITSLMRD